MAESLPPETSTSQLRALWMWNLTGQQGFADGPVLRETVWVDPMY